MTLSAMAASSLPDTEHAGVRLRTSKNPGWPVRAIHQHEARFGLDTEHEFKAAKGKLRPQGVRGLGVGQSENQSFVATASWRVV